MQEFSVQALLTTPTVAVRDVGCRGSCRHQSAEECAAATHLVFPSRGVYVRHVGGDNAVAEANQVLLFNAGEAYRVSHPVAGGDASLVIAVAEPLLRELAPKELTRDGARPAIWRGAGRWPTSPPRYAARRFISRRSSSRWRACRYTAISSGCV